jgi:hypothetical protein
MKTGHGYTEEQLFIKFTKDARYQGGDCYTICFFGHTLYNSCTGKLFEEWKKCFVHRDERYYYS